MDNIMKIGLSRLASLRGVVCTPKQSQQSQRLLPRPAASAAKRRGGRAKDALAMTRRFFPKLANKRGNILALTFLVIIVLVLLGAAVVIMSFNESRLVERQRMTMQALHIAEAGLEKAVPVPLCW